MYNYVLLYYPIAAVIILLGGCKVARKGTFSACMWDRVQAKNLEAIACIFVILHHLTQEISGYGEIDRGPITVLSKYAESYRQQHYIS